VGWVGRQAFCLFWRRQCASCSGCGSRVGRVSGLRGGRGVAAGCQPTADLWRGWPGGGHISFALWINRRHLRLGSVACVSCGCSSICKLVGCACPQLLAKGQRCARTRFLCRSRQGRSGSVCPVWPLLLFLLLLLLLLLLLELCALLLLDLSGCLGPAKAQMRVALF